MIQQMSRGLVVALLGLGAMGVLTAGSASASSFIGWQTFSNCGANNDTGVCDTTPESNSTYDATPVGGIGPANTYLTGAIGVNASAGSRVGRGQQTNNAFLNGAGFGNESADSSRLIQNVTLADGSLGVRIGPFGSATQGAPDGTSSWKFSTNNDARTGDIRVTNESAYYFRIQFIHFDARVGNANSPQNLEIKYLSGDGTAFDNGLTRFDTSTELVDLTNVYNNDFGPGPATFNVSHSIGGALSTQTFLAPGESAGFRFVWTDFVTSGAESQLDNIAFEGQFFETAALLIELDPAAVGTVPTTYYVSSSSGDDLNDGLSQGAAFETLSAVNSLNLQPGDQVLFKSGDVWHGMLWPKGSGTHAQPIQIGSYGGTIKPVIDGDGYQASLLVFNDDHYEITDLELTNQASHLDGSNPKTEPGFGGVENDDGDGQDVRFGLKIVASTRSLSGFSLSNLLITDVYPTPTNPSYAHQGYGIKFESQSDIPTNAIYTVSDVEMDSLEVSRTGHYGVWIRPLGLVGSDDHKHNDFTLRDSTFVDTGGAGFVAVKASNVLVEDSVFDGTGSSLDARMWKRGSGLWTFDSRDVVIQHNVVRNARGPLDSYGVHIDYNNENVTVQYNYSYNNEGGFVQILGANLDCGYRYNISVSDGSRVSGVGGALQDGRIFNVSDFCNVPAGCPSVGNFIYNNTVFVPSSFSPDIVFQAGSGETFFHNNLIVVEAGSPVLNTDVSGAGATYDISNNLFYPLALFALDPELTSDAHYVDPQLLMPGADDAAMYKLATGSPAKFIGTVISSGQDFFGFPVDGNSAPHIGAYNGNETLHPAPVPAVGAPLRLLAALGLCCIAAWYSRSRS